MTTSASRRLPPVGRITQRDLARMREQLASGCRVFPKQLIAQWNIGAELAERLVREHERPTAKH